MSFVSVQSYVPTIVYGDNQKVIIHRNQTMGSLEAKSGRRVYLARVCESCIDHRPLAKRVGSEGKGVEVVRLVNHEYAQRIMVFRVGEGNTGWPYGLRKSEVKD